MTSRTALSCRFVPSNTITQFGLQSWFSRDKLGERKQDDEGQEREREHQRVGEGRGKVKEKEKSEEGRNRVREKFICD